MAQPTAATIGSIASAVITATLPRLSSRKLEISDRSRANRAPRASFCIAAMTIAHLQTIARF